MNIWWSQTVVEGVGWTLVHFLWEGLVIAALLAVGLRMMRSAPAHYRYLAGCAAMLLMAIAPLLTFQQVMKQDESPVLPVVETVATAPAIEEIPAQPSEPVTKIVVIADSAVAAKKVSGRGFESWMPWLVAFWLAGVFALSCRLFAGWMQVRRLKRVPAGPLEPEWQEKFLELARRLGINRAVRVLQSAWVEVPTVIGWLKPVVLLPASCLTGLTPAQLESILAHELAHIRRHDYLVNLLQSAVETLLFYHPAVWWVSRRIREERENCCDDLAVVVSGDRVGYARALAMLEQLRSAPAQLAMAADGAPLLSRIRRLLGQSERSAGRPAWPLAGIFVVMLLAIVALGLRDNRAQAANETQNQPGPTQQQVNPTNSIPPAFAATNVPASQTVAAASVATLVKDAVFLMEAGKLEEADAKLKQALVEDPSNVAAFQYQQLVTEKRNTDAILEYARRNPGTRVSLGQQAIITKLGRIRVESVKYPELSLSHVLADLAERAKHGDSEGKGINFFMSRDIAAHKPGEEQVDINEVKVTANLENVRLAEVLDAITKTADHPIKYSILDYAVMFSFKDTNGRPLETRVFRVDTNTFVQRLQGVVGIPFGAATSNATVGGISFVSSTNSTDVLSGLVRNFFAAAGVDLTTNATGKAVFFNDRKGILSVHATPAELDLIEEALLNLTGETPATSSNAQVAGLETRVFHVDTNRFLQHLQGIVATGGIYGGYMSGGSGAGWGMGLGPDPGERIGTFNGTNASALRRAFFTFFAAAGVDLSTNAAGKAVFYNDRKGILTVHAMPAELDLIEQALHNLYAQPPQVNIKMRLVEINQAAGSNAMDPLFAGGNVQYLTNTPGVFNFAQTMLAPSQSTTVGAYRTIVMASNSTAAPNLAVLSQPHYRMISEQLIKMADVKVLPPAEITTLSGRQSQIQVVQTLKAIGIPTNPNGAGLPDAPTNGPLVGPVLDIIPTVTADEQSIQMAVNITVTEFMGYHTPTGTAPDGTTFTSGVPLPLYRMRQVTNSFTIRDAQTVMIGGFVTEDIELAYGRIRVLRDLPGGGGHFENVSTNKSKKNLVIFITATVINPDGTRLHSDDELPPVRR